MATPAINPSHALHPRSQTDGQTLTPDHLNVIIFALQSDPSVTLCARWLVGTGQEGFKAVHK